MFISGVIWDSREIEDTSAVMTSLSQISPNYEMHEMTFRAEYIDLSTLDVMGVKEAGKPDVDFTPKYV